MKMKKKGNENEVKVKIRWKLLNQDAKRGTQKKKEGENTNTWNLARSGQTLDTEQDQRRAGGRKCLNQPNTAKTYAYLEGPNLPVEGRTHEIGNPCGTS